LVCVGLFFDYLESFSPGHGFDPTIIDNNGGETVHDEITNFFISLILLQNNFKQFDMTQYQFVFDLNFSFDGFEKQLFEHVTEIYQIFATDSGVVQPSDELMEEFVERVELGDVFLEVDVEDGEVFLEEGYLLVF
jgi:hypothetical protein